MVHGDFWCHCDYSQAQSNCFSSTYSSNSVKSITYREESVLSICDSALISSQFLPSVRAANIWLNKKTTDEAVLVLKEEVS